MNYREEIINKIGRDCSVHHPNTGKEIMAAYGCEYIFMFKDWNVTI